MLCHSFFSVSEALSKKISKLLLPNLCTGNLCAYQQSFSPPSLCLTINATPAAFSTDFAVTCHKFAPSRLLVMARILPSFFKTSERVNMSFCVTTGFIHLFSLHTLAHIQLSEEMIRPSPSRSVFLAAGSVWVGSNRLLSSPTHCLPPPRVPSTVFLFDVFIFTR